MRYGFPEASHEQVLAAAQTANMDFVLGNSKGKKLIDWQDSVGPKGSKLSGGQKQVFFHWSDDSLETIIIY